MPSLRHVIRSGWPIRLAVVLVNKALPAYRSRLYTPTFLDRLGNEYILVDCWHHRVLVGTDLNTPISAWRTLVTNLSGPPAGTPNWSPDGSLIAFDARLPGSAIFVIPFSGGSPRQLTTGATL